MMGLAVLGTSSQAPTLVTERTYAELAQEAVAIHPLPILPLASLMLRHTRKYHFRWKSSGPGQGVAPPQERDENESMSQ